MLSGEEQVKQSKVYDSQTSTNSSINTKCLLAVATQPQLQQVMGHRDAGIYQAYNVDPRALVLPALTEINALKVDSEIVHL